MDEESYRIGVRSIRGEEDMIFVEIVYRSRGGRRKIMRVNGRDID